MSDREAVHQLVDELPEGELASARQMLESLRGGFDGVEGVLTPEELAEIGKAREAMRRGEWITLDEYKRERGL